MVNYNGSCRQLIAAFESSQPFDVVYWKGILYWTDRNTTSIMQTNIKDGNTTLYKYVGEKSYAIGFYHDDCKW